MGGSAGDWGGGVAVALRLPSDLAPRMSMGGGVSPMEGGGMRIVRGLGDGVIEGDEDEEDTKDDDDGAGKDGDRVGSELDLCNKPWGSGWE